MRTKRSYTCKVKVYINNEYKEDWKGKTFAVSDEQAANNFKYQIKRRWNLPNYASVQLEGTIKEEPYDSEEES